MTMWPLVLFVKKLFGCLRITIFLSCAV